MTPHLPPGTNDQRWTLLRHCRALEGLSDGALRDISRAATEQSFETGEALLRQGEPADGLMILLEGAAHVILSQPEVDDQRIGRLSSGDIVGEMALVTREPRSATVIADAPVRALLVPTAAFDSLAARHLELSTLLTDLVANRLGQAAHDGFGGKQVEEFRILRCVGRGGMSVVYRAREESTGEAVALKMMSYRLVYDRVAMARFHQEAEVLQSLDHANIARVRRLFSAYHTYFLVVELCEGVDLQRLLWARGPLTESRVRPILGQLALALDYVHRRQLVHRDIKPANVIVTRQGQVKLTDFGLAAPAFSVDDRTRTADQSMMGTPAFMAPEQLSNGPVDARTDVYALGCLAYDLLAGQHLFRAKSLLDLAVQKMSVELPPATEIGGGISTELYDFIHGALRVNPADRPASVAALIPWADRCDPPPADLVDETVGV